MSLNDAESSGEESKTGSTTAERAPPPILIRDTLAWPKVQAAITTNGIACRRSVNTSNGVKVYARSTDDFRTLTEYLENKKLEHSTHQLPEDHDLVFVIRGVNQGLSEEDIHDETSKKIPHVRRVHRMKSGEKIWPLVTVHLDAAEKSSKTIFNLTHLGGLSIKVEPKCKSATIPQCSRCQKYNHTHNYCHATWVCAFCGRNHATPACSSKDQKDAKPTCANCSGDHRASYRG
ncbi:hypothetical protein QAD02_001572 [Eretmocerus hayati]|uniref:Uncharacterized protein n=1 Tax=Eretmocerus hayati TaxID=131215 RepID=A0ACC2NGK2_9HYME|nr:hypothetical protein QAD02_001572 [Eretmocerus hayati]